MMMAQMLIVFHVQLLVQHVHQDRHVVHALDQIEWDQSVIRI